MPPLSYFVIAGPTAVGKSAVAVEVAGRVDGEIVGADAFQVYRALERLTAQPSPDQLRRVPHHLVGHVWPAQAYHVAQWLAEARAAIADIRSRGKLPILCGGSGLYLRALDRGLDDLPPGDAGVRQRLEERPLAQLRDRLLQIEPDTSVDLQNPRRVIRALEIFELTGQAPGDIRQKWEQAEPRRNGVLLWRERMELRDRIANRTAAMFDEEVLEEVRRLPKSAVGPTAAQTLGLSLLRACLAGLLSRAEAENRLNIATRQYAKRQLTWFRREPGLLPLEVRAEDEPVSAIVQEITRLLSTP